MDYRKKVIEACKKVYPKVVDLKCTHKGGADTYSEIVSKKVANCSGTVSAVLKLAGCMDDGLLNHTSAVSSNITKKKDTIAKAMTGKTKNIKWVWFGEKYDDLPSEAKKEGVIYVQDSNICINAGNGYIWSCNLTGKKYTSLDMVKKKSGYVKDSPILVYGIPQIVKRNIVDIYHGDVISSYEDFCNDNYFVVHKATQGTTFVDDKAKSRCQAFEDRKEPFWLYVFLNDGHEKEQVQFMVKNFESFVKDKKYFIGWVLDIEKGNAQSNCITAYKWLLDYSKKNGHKIMLYMMYSQYGKYASLLNIASADKDRVALWEARYTNKYKPHDDADLWQYAEDGTCEGMSNKGDVNRLTGVRPLSWFTTKAQPIKAEKYSGVLPAMPPRGYYQHGDGVTTYKDYPTQLKRVQEALKWAGYKGKPDKDHKEGEVLEIDGKYLDNTEYAVRSLQKEHGLPVNGKYGNKCNEVISKLEKR